ncbi:MAG: hypothetical protein DCC73_11450 [Proteobacteria bacterium]|nr:MAG: hypothetical protein DCC73_11450 [Pseudomonadota bacterium]
MAMTIKEKLKSGLRKLSAAAVTAAPPAAAGADIGALRARHLRIGMWVMTEAGVGVLHGFPAPALGTVHLVDDAGLVAKILTVKLQDVRAALFAEIPPAKRRHLTSFQARLMGYL